MEDELHTRKLQVLEMVRVIQVESDFEFAFQLQLKEAMEVSELVSSSGACEQVVSLACMRSAPLDSCTSLDSCDEEDAKVTIDRDRRIAVKQQEDEIERLEQEIAGLEKARRVQCTLQEMLAIFNHDAQFARFLNSVPEGQWMKTGELLANPFVAAPDTVVSSNDASSCASGKTKVIVEVACDANYDCTKGTSKAAEKDFYITPSRSTKRKAMDSEHLLESTVCHHDIWEPALAAAFMFRTEGNDTCGYEAAVNQRHEFGATLTVDADQDDKPEIDGLPKLFCDICLELKKIPENVLSIATCNHHYCVDCLKQHGENEVKMGKAYINCPQLGCAVMWSTQQCSFLLSTASCQILIRREV